MMGRIKLICLKFLQENWLVVCVILIFFLAGLIFGAFGAKNLDQSVKTDLSRIMQNFIAKIPVTAINNGEVVKASLVKNLYIILSMYVLGLSVIGALLVPVLVFTRGFTLGFTMGFLVNDKAWKGVVLSFASIIPQNIIYVPSLLVGGVLTVAFSVFFIRGRLMFRGFETRRPLVFYTLGMICTTALTSLGCIFEAFITPSLIKYTTALLF